MALIGYLSSSHSLVSSMYTLDYFIDYLTYHTIVNSIEFSMASGSVVGAGTTKKLKYENSLLFL